MSNQSNHNPNAAQSDFRAVRQHSPHTTIQQGLLALYRNDVAHRLITLKRQSVPELARCRHRSILLLEFDVKRQLHQGVFQFIYMSKKLTWSKPLVHCAGTTWGDFDRSTTALNISNWSTGRSTTGEICRDLSTGTTTWSGSKNVTQTLSMNPEEFGTNKEQYQKTVIKFSRSNL